MRHKQVEVVVAGHICLDIFPGLSANADAAGALFTPGKLVDMGPVELSTGGAVANTGVALQRLGASTILMGKVGDDPFGRIILEFLRRHSSQLVAGMRIARDAQTSYTIVLSHPRLDRCFLHCPGANDTFCANDLNYGLLSKAKLFHFGYPPLMRGMYCDGGRNLAAMLGRAKARKLATSLDMALPDPASPAGRADWKGLLKRALPFTDVFLPSLDELLFMADRRLFERLKAKAGAAGITAAIDGRLLERLSARMLDLGAAIVAIKLGSQGFFVRTTASRERLQALGRSVSLDGGWRGRELMAPCFKVKVAGTTGSGDCTIAGFLLGLLRGWPIEKTLVMGVAVGACSVEKPDATSGVQPCAEVQARLSRGWPQHKVAVPLRGWRWDEPARVWRGPADNS